MNLKDLQENWHRLAEADPLWAILAHPERKGGRWELTEFLATGRAEIRRTLNDLEDLGLRLREGRALDFGCGVGRLTHALAAHFDHAFGVDIAPAMIEEARRIHADRENCSFVLNERGDLSLFPDGYFNLVYSSITLQHMQPRYARAYLREFVRLLAPGGVLVFQLAGRPRRVGVWMVSCVLPRFMRPVVQRVIHGGGPLMQMYGARSRKVVDLLMALGMRIVQVREDGKAGPDWTGFRYVAVKRERAAPAERIAAPPADDP